MKLYPLLFAWWLLLPAPVFAQPESEKHTAFVLPESVSSADYLPGTVILRIRPELRAQCSEHHIGIAALQQVFNAAGVNSSAKIFPWKHPPAATHKARTGQALVDLSLIYEVTYTSSQPIEKVINRILATGAVEYAEPRYLARLLYTPNDPALGNQYEHPLLRSFEAWDISKGDTSVVIGVSDTGTDIDHEDLAGNIRYNYNDPINGLDDDNDGYTDNFRGWDLGENDNDPSSNDIGKHHGVFVSGLCSAVPDNGKGMAGTGFNCKFLPLKITDSKGGLTKGYESIVYAADHGCSIVNCSWGSKSGKSQYQQDIINYAAINADVLVVAAAGNDNDAVPFYPASYDNVLSVAATGPNDVKWGGSSYGSKVDICAPGDFVYSTWNGNGYIKSSGTSFASPIVAGCAAIVRSHLPQYSALQVAQLLKATADNIDTVAGNAAWQGLLGAGRVNLFRALTETGKPSVALTGLAATDGYDEVIVSGDTIRITGTFTNFLGPAASLHVKIQTSAFATVTDDSTMIGPMGTMAVKDNAGDPFVIAVSPSSPPSAAITLTFLYYDSVFLGSETAVIVANPGYINVTVNNISTTVTSKGSLGYNTLVQTDGLGFAYKDSNTLIYEAGLMVGVPGKVSDNIRGVQGWDTDFRSLETVRRVLPAVTSDFDLYGRFNDDLAGTGRLSVEIAHRTYAWAAAPDDGYIIREYTVRNKGIDVLDSLYAGVLADWDIQDYSRNRGGYDAEKRLGYAFSIQPGGLYAGVKLLSDTVAVCHHLDNIAGGGGGVNLDDGFSAAEKYTTLSMQRSQAGTALGGNDVLSVVSAGPYRLDPGDSITVAFALLAAESLAELTQSGQRAQVKYNPALTGAEESPAAHSLLLYPNPAGDEVNILLNGFPGGEVRIRSADGRLAGRHPVNGSGLLTIPRNGLPAGLYFVEIAGNGRETARMRFVFR